MIDLGGLGAIGNQTLAADETNSGLLQVGESQAEIGNVHGELLLFHHKSKSNLFSGWLIDTLSSQVVLLNSVQLVPTARILLGKPVLELDSL